MSDRSSRLIRNALLLGSALSAVAVVTPAAAQSASANGPQAVDETPAITAIASPRGIFICQDGDDAGICANTARRPLAVRPSPRDFMRDAMLSNSRTAPVLRADAAPAATAAPAAAYAEQGKVGDPASWRTTEFKQDWGLGAIGAEYAYARGLTGKNVMLGLFDSGVMMSNPEFAGKANKGLVIGDLLPDGTRCGADLTIGGPTSCFGTDGGRAQIEATYYDPEIAPYLKPEYQYLAGKTALAWGAHGTHVAGTMTANRDGTGMHGVAFGSTFASARLFGDSFEILDIGCAFFGQCIGTSASASTSAFTDMYTQMNNAGVRALNHSWGLAREPIDKAGQDALFNNAAFRPRLDEIRAGSLSKGMLQVWAAGNTASVISTPAQSPIAGVYASLPRLFPELEKYWVAVANLSETGNAANPYVLSNRSMQCGLAMNWCIAAPGTAIASTVVEGESFAGDLGLDADGNYVLIGKETLPANPGYASMSGTSMASPHVTGALALLFERYPYLEGFQVRDVMLTTATDLGAPGVDPIYGWGMLNLKKAIDGPGQLRVNTDVVMNTRAGGAKTWAGDAWDNWANDISGPGRLSFASANNGWLRLSGANSFNGATVKSGTLELTGANRLTSDVVVDGGTFILGGTMNGSALTVNGGLAVVNGTLTNGLTTINAKGRLQGTGTLAATTVYGTIAPGNSIGTLVINGPYTQQAGSVYEAEMRPPSETDLIRVNGTAKIAGTVKAVRQPGVYALGQTYTLLTATGGITGTYNTLDTTAVSPFLGLALAYGPNAVTLRVARGATFASAAQTFNTTQVAGALDKLPDTSPIVQSVVMLDAATARGAFDQLSGEIHPTMRTVAISNSAYMRNAAFNRARVGNEPYAAYVEARPGVALWANYTDGHNKLRGDGNAATARTSSYNWMGGADFVFGENSRFGLLGGYQSDRVGVDARGSTGRMESTAFGIYGAQRFGQLGLSAGYIHGWDKVRTRRSVLYTGFGDTVAGAYDATTQQAFADIGYRIGSAGGSIEPFAQYAYVDYDSDAFKETGASAALSGRVKQSGASVGTVGLRGAAALKLTPVEADWLSLNGTVGYRFADNVLPQAAMALTGGQAFTVRGAPLAKSAAIAEFGASAHVGQNMLVRVGYAGQLSKQERNNSFNAMVSFKF